MEKWGNDEIRHGLWEFETRAVRISTTVGMD